MVQQVERGQEGLLTRERSLLQDGAHWLSSANTWGIDFSSANSWGHHQLGSIPIPLLSTPKGAQLKGADTSVVVVFSDFVFSDCFGKTTQLVFVQKLFLSLQLEVVVFFHLIIIKFLISLILLPFCYVLSFTGPQLEHTSVHLPLGGINN